MSSLPKRWEPESPTRPDWVVAVALFAAAFLALLWTGEIGIPRDESFYLKAGNDYAAWFEELWKNYRAGELSESFTRQNIDRHWSYNPEHPVLMKTAFGLSRLLFTDYLGWVRGVTASRIPGMVTGAAAVSVTYLFGRQVFGRLAGVVAAGALFFQPRYFAHSHFACFDVPITFFWLATIYAYWRSLDSEAWAVGTGLLWGLALCTKLNAFFLPVVVVGHWLTTNWTEFGLRDSEGGWAVRVPPLPRAFVYMAILGPGLLYLLTPRFWFDTSQRVSSYIAFHLEHVHYFVYYFGENLKNPPHPIHYPWVMTLVTVPATILIAGGLGLVQAGLTWDPLDWGHRWWSALRSGSSPDRRIGDPRGTALLLVVNLVFPILLISLPSTPIFGGTKHWMPAMPFLALFAGAGVLLAWRLLLGLRGARSGSSSVDLPASLAAVALSAAVLVPAGYSTAHVHPFGLSYYNEWIGSIRGAADHRMFRQFWGYSSRQALPWLNEHAKPDGRVSTMNMTGYAWWWYGDGNLVRDDLSATGRGASDYAIYHHQQAFSEEHGDLWQDYGTYAPAHVLSHEGVPLVSIYRRPRLLETAEDAADD